MRVKPGVSTVTLQFGKAVVAGDRTFTISTDPAIDLSSDVCVTMTSHENVSISILKQTVDEFLITTSDTGNASAEYLIASTI
jgi:hypothetical protein